MKLGVALLRMIIGSLFVGHGLQKLAGWFGGNGLQATGASFEKLGLRPGRVHATASGAAETAGGALLSAGYLTPLGASLISGSMITAIRKVHAPKGVWVSDGGYEYNLVLLAAAFAITDLGPGALSIDEVRGKRRAGPLWALAQLAAGALGSTAAIAFGARQSAAAESDDSGQQPTGAQPVQHEHSSNGGEGPETLEDEVAAAANGQAGGIATGT